MQIQSSNVSVSSNSFPVYSYKGNKNIIVRVGDIIEGDTYVSHRSYEKHFFRIFKGYANSVDVYNVWMTHGVKWVLLIIDDQQKALKSKVSQWKHTSTYPNEILNTKQIDPQWVLEESAMKVVKGGFTIMDNQTDLDKIGPVQSAGVDLAKYDKQTTTIEKAEVTQLPSQFTPLIPGTQQHYMQWVLKVSSVVLESIREGEDKIEFRATEVFNLIQDEKGNLKGYPTGEGAKLMKFLKDLKVPNLDQLKSLKEVIEAVKGKTCVIKAEAKERDGRTNTYLRFRY
jgi:hypothetical protein